MLKDIPYSTLKQEKRNYEILLLRDQYGNTFTDLAKEFSLSTERIKQIYNRTKIRQIRLYTNHIAIALGQEEPSQIRKLYTDAYECYQDDSYACAYLEKRFQDILTEYRNGEPGMPAHFLESMPPFQTGLSDKTIARVIEMREEEKASFTAIGKELRITQQKARHTYQHFYHKQALELLKNLQETAESPEERKAIWEHYFCGYKSSKKRYDLLLEELRRGQERSPKGKSPVPGKA